MTRILALDTAAQFGSLALAADGVVVEEVVLHSPEGFSTTLFGHISILLARHGWTLDSVDCFAAAAGPGSFTGVRVGLAAAKGLAEAFGKRVAAVSNLEALADAGSLPLRAAVIDARRGEVYGGLYDSSLQPLAPEVVEKFPAWLAGLPDGPIEFLSPDFLPFRTALESSRFSRAPVTELRSLAGSVARIGSRRFSRGEAADPAAIDANYVRRSDAELLWKDSR